MFIKAESRASDYYVCTKASLGWNSILNINYAYWLTLALQHFGQASVASGWKLQCISLFMTLSFYLFSIILCEKNESGVKVASAICEKCLKNGWKWPKMPENRKNTFWGRLKKFNIKNCAIIAEIDFSFLSKFGANIICVKFLLRNKGRQ